MYKTNLLGSFRGIDARGTHFANLVAKIRLTVPKILRDPRACTNQILTGELKFPTMFAC